MTTLIKTVGIEVLRLALRLPLLLLCVVSLCFLLLILLINQFRERK